MKKIVFLSNYFSHHQEPFSNAIYNRLCGSYLFIETEPMDEERLSMGWGINQKPEYLISYDDFLRDKAKYIRVINEADIVVIGSAPECLIKERIRQGKLIVRYSERFFKKGLQLWKYPIRYIRWHQYVPRNKPIYMLCASAFTSADFKKFGLFNNKCYKWGYFPEVKKYDDFDELIGNKKKNTLLWAGRLIDWKHPELPIEIAKRLKKDGIDFQLNIIGNGIMEAELKELINDYDLEDNVKMLGSMSPEKVRAHMEESEIYLFTSDRQEGWGAVLNESMNSGCAVVASHIIGSVPFLIKDGENGLIYRDGDIEDLYGKVKFLLDNPKKRAEMGKKAYETLCNEWNAENAADKFIKLSREILKGNKNPDLFEDGVCSKAPILKDGWYKK